VPKFCLDLTECKTPVPTPALDLFPIAFPWPGFVKGDSYIEGSAVRFTKVNPTHSDTVALFSTPSTVLFAFYVEPGKSLVLRSNGVIVGVVPEGLNVSSEDQPWETPVSNRIPLNQIMFFAAGFDGQYLYMKTETGRLQKSSIAHPPVSTTTLFDGDVLCYQIQKHNGWIGEEACDVAMEKMRYNLT